MSAPALALLFGTPELEHAGSRWALPSERRSQLLALLALKRGWIGRAEVAALLWPDQDTRLAYSNLRKTLFRLHAQPWGALVQTEGGALRFAGETDVAAFETALQQQRLADALALRRGELLSSFDDDANEAWTTWLAYERERLRVAWQGAALTWLAGDVPGPAAVALSARLLEADPLDEGALRMHVAWLQRTGQAAAARDVHARFVQRLAGELGLAPGAALQSLGVSLQAQHPPAPPPAAVPVPIAAGGGTQIDAGFIGRGAELRHIASLLAQDDCRLVCLLGPGGVGKTRLARRALQELARGFADGTAFVALEDVTGADGFGDALARALGVRPADHGGALAASLDALQPRQMLLALDNAESVPQAAASVQRLLEACPGIKLLVTSRTRLSLADEWSVTVEGLPCPDPEDLDRADAFDAVRLFLRTARRVQPDFSGAADLAVVADICRQVEGLPLALEWAAAWVRVLSCREIATELRAGTDLLRADAAGRPARHASIEQVFEQSWQRLSDAERQVLARLSVFRGGFDAVAARVAAAASLPVLAALADKSLLHKEPARLRLHPLVQQLAAARLPAPARAEMAQAHAAHYLQRLLRVRRDVENGSQQALNELDTEGDNIRAAWRWAATAGPAARADAPTGQAQAGLLAQAALILMYHSDHRGSRHDALNAALTAVASPAAQRHPALRAVLLAACAHLQYRLDRLDEAMATAGAALALSREAGLGEAGDAGVQALRVIAGCHLRQGRLDACREHYLQALQLAADGSDPRSVAMTLGNLALVDKRQGRFDEALRLSLDALQRLRELGSVADEARCLNNLADLEMAMGAFEQAGSHLREGLALCERHGIRGTEGLLLGNLSFVLEHEGDLDVASRYARQSQAVLADVGDRISGIAIQLQLARLEMRQGRPAGAHEELAASMAQALAIANAPLQLRGLLLASELMAPADAAAAAAVRDFVAAHPAADAPLRQEAAGPRGAHAESGEAVRWPPALSLSQAAECIAADRRAGVERLRRLLRGRGDAH